MSNPLSKEMYYLATGYVDGCLVLEGYKDLNVIDIVLSFRRDDVRPSLTFVVDGPVSSGIVPVADKKHLKEVGHIINKKLKNVRIVKL